MPGVGKDLCLSCSHRPSLPTPAIAFVLAVWFGLVTAPMEAKVAERLPVATRPFGPPAQPSRATAVLGEGTDAALLFSTTTDSLTSFWRTEGTRETTELFLGPEELPFTSPLSNALGFAFFHRSSGSTVELWRTDGTPEGTISLGLTFSSSTNTGLASPPLVELGDVALTWIRVADQVEMWRTDGTPVGTSKVMTLDTLFVESAFPVGDRVLFSAFSRLSEPRLQAVALWITDGTEEGTRLLQDPITGSLGGAEPLGGDIIFLNGSPVSEPQSFLWYTDGTPAGTRQIVEGPLVWLVDRNGFAAFGGAVYFLDSEGLWRTDGTEAGTTLVFERQEQPFAAELDCRREMIATSDALFFVLPAADHCELWTTAGPAGSETLLEEFPIFAFSSRFLGAVGDRVFLSLSDEGHGTELWSTDGSSEGTVLIHDIAPGPTSSGPEAIGVAGENLFFRAFDGPGSKELWALPLDPTADTCLLTDHALCLRDRFRLEARWRDFRDREADAGTRGITQDTGSFWFFRPENLELVTKILDGREVNDHFWTFYGALSNVEYWLTVTDTQTGLTRRYFNPSGTFASVGDTRSFGPLGASLLTSPTQSSIQGGALPEIARYQVDPDHLEGSCAPSSERLCLNGGRFAVETTWTDFRGDTGTGKAQDLTDDTGYFWFFKDTNVELVLKVLDGRANNGNYWVFYGSLSNVDFDITVTDTDTGQVRVYRNRSRLFASVGDTGAFPPL